MRRGVDWVRLIYQTVFDRDRNAMLKTTIEPAAADKPALTIVNAEGYEAFVAELKALMPKQAPR